jgi:hypothetical protein
VTCLLLLLTTRSHAFQNTGPENVQFASKAPAGTYVAESSLGFNAYEIAKYSSSGKVLWKHAQTVDKTLWPSVAGCAADSAGAVYFAADYEYLKGENHSSWLIAKWNRDGSQAWSKIVPAKSSFMANAVAGVGRGGFVAAGRGSIPSGQKKPMMGIVTSRFDGDGNCLWEQFYGDLYPNSYSVSQVVTAVDGSSYIVGEFDEVLKKSLLLLHYSADGKLLWFRKRDLADSDSTNFMLQSIKDGVAVAWQGMTAKSFGFTASHYDSRGKLLYKNTFNSKRTAFLLGMAADDTGRIAMVGFESAQSNVPVEGYFYMRSIVFVTKPTGGLQFMFESPEAVNDTYAGRQVEFGPNGSLYESEVFCDPASYQTLSVRRFSASGKQLWHKILPFKEITSQYASNAHKLLVDAAGNLILFAPVMGGLNEFTNCGFFKITPAGKLTASHNEDLRLTPNH